MGWGSSKTPRAIPILSRSEWPPPSKWGSLVTVCVPTYPARAGFHKTWEVKPMGEEEWPGFNDDQAFRDLLRCLVGVYGEVRGPDGKAMRAAYSGVLVQVDDQTVVCGAGHCFQEIDYFVSRGQRTKRCYLLDPAHPGLQRKGAIAIDWELSKPYIVVDDKGIDFGAIFLNDLACRGLKSTGKLPIKVADPAAPADPPALGYYLMGFPNAHSKFTDQQLHLFVARYRVNEQPSAPELTYVPSIAQFYGEIPVDPGSLKGVSGGPIFRVFRDAATMKYYSTLHAIMRAQRGREIFGPLMVPLIQMLRQEMARRRGQ